MTGWGINISNYALAHTYKKNLKRKEDLRQKLEQPEMLPKAERQDAECSLSPQTSGYSRAYFINFSPKGADSLTLKHEPFIAASINEITALLYMLRLFSVCMKG